MGDFGLEVEAESNIPSTTEDRFRAVVFQRSLGDV